MNSLRMVLLATTILVSAAGVHAQDNASNPPVETGTDAGLQLWLNGFRTRAIAAGIDAAVVEAATGQISYDPDVIRRDRTQSEFTKTIWDYLETATSDLRIANGKTALSRQRDALTQIEALYGVDKEVIVAIWGLESAYGTFRGSDNVIRSLASLAYDGRRRDFFEAELLDALRIIQAKDTHLDQMTGSWAGAMGHTQFMPSSFLAHAVDFNKDARRNIWGDDPRDALESTAAYLKHFGWIKGQALGVEITLPSDFNYLLADREVLKSAPDWAALGVVSASRTALPDDGPAFVLLPGGAEGAAFLIYSNFDVIEKYNTADAYVIAVGHLADRIAGGPPIRHSWPEQDRALSYDERIELQTRLTALGFDTVKIDAKIGPLTIDAVRRFQVAKGLLPDGYASLRLLNRIRAAE